MCWREYKTGKNYLQDDKGESDYFCSHCLPEYAEKCHAGILNPKETAERMETFQQDLTGRLIHKYGKNQISYGTRTDEEAEEILKELKAKEPKQAKEQAKEQEKTEEPKEQELKDFLEQCKNSTGHGYIAVSTSKKSDLNGIKKTFSIETTVEHKQTKHDSFGGSWGMGGAYEATPENKEKLAEEIINFFYTELDEPFFPATEKERIGTGWFRDIPDQNYAYFLDKDAKEFLKDKTADIEKKIAELKEKTRKAKQQEILWAIEEKELEENKADYETVNAVREKLREMNCFE